MPDGNANVCNKCGLCIEKCPQRINIPEELEKVKNNLGKQTPVLSMFK